MDTPYVIAIGELLWDLLPNGKKPGGAPANVLYHLHQLGYQTDLVSSVGDDALGTELLDYIKAHKLNTKFIHKSALHPTGTVKVDLKNGTPSYTITESVAWDFIPSTTRIIKQIATADALIFGSLAQRCHKSKKTIKELLAAKKKDCIALFDVNIRKPFIQKNVVIESLHYANILKLNDDELPALCTYVGIPFENDVSSCTQILYKFDLELVALTKGSKGSVLIGKHATYKQAATTVKICDTVGAGDAFSAAIIDGMIRKDSLQNMIKKAHFLASWVTKQSGAMPSYSSLITNAYNAA